MNRCVQLEWKNMHTAIVQMQDNINNNLLSEELFQELITSFATINANSQAKCVILTGLSTQFCAGNNKINYGTQQPFYEILLNCELPVIAAMEGNALGDGLAFAAYADIIILAEESHYSSHFLNESITDNFAASYIIPKKFGFLLGSEILYNPDVYSGDILKSYNLPIKIVSKSQVLTTAKELAEAFNEKLEPSLRLLKQHLARIIKYEINTSNKFN